MAPANAKTYIQAGLHRANESRAAREENGLVTEEAGENEILQFPVGFLKEVVSVTYGTLDSVDSPWADVKSKIAGDLLAGKAVTVNNQVMGLDPKPYVRKVLCLQYHCDAEPQEVTAAEGKVLSLPPGSGEGIVSARYGAKDSFLDVTMPLKQMVLSGSSVTVSNQAFGKDPIHGVVKSLEVKYQPKPRLTFKLHTGKELGTFEVLAPWLFSALRQALGIDSSDFYDSLISAQLKGGETEASGKSGEIFFRTHDERFILKTVSEEEICTLIGMLPDYQEHLCKNPDSLLTRYLAAYRLIIDDSTTFLVVMNNVFLGAADIAVMYDLKGTTEDRWVDPSGGKCLKDNNFAGITEFMEERDVNALHDMIMEDTKFLESKDIMDYSFMLAVGTKPPSGGQRPFSRLMGGLPARESEGVLSSPKDCTLYIGMVDMLVTFGWKKQVAHVVKSMTIGLADEIDTMPPGFYASRFRTYLRHKFRKLADCVSLSEVSADCFETPMPALGRSGGTAAFYQTVLRPGASPEADQSLNYWIGKDLARARDEVTFYEEAEALKGSKEWAVLRWMTPYKGICKAPCLAEEGKPPRDVDLMLLRNCRDGFQTCRMLDIKVGNVTAVAGWQGKDTLSAWMQNMTIDTHTNSCDEGFRLEGFDNPPDVLKSMEAIVVDGAPQSTHKKLKRFHLQRLQASDILKLFLDLHDTVPRPQTALRGGYPAAGNQEAATNLDANQAVLMRVEVQELVLLRCIEQLSELVAACNDAPVPQQWIGSSVMLCFDSGSRPPRTAFASASAAANMARVHIFDWGRSELNADSKHALLGESDRKERTRYWTLYRAALAKLLYNCCCLYLYRFWQPMKSLTFSVWDKDSLKADEFVGLCSLPLQEAKSKSLHLKSFRGDDVKSGLLWKAQTSLEVSASSMPLPSNSRLKDAWVARIHRAAHIPRLDITSESDPFVEVTAMPVDPEEAAARCTLKGAERLLRSAAHVTSVVKDSPSPTWEEEFEFASLCDEARGPFLRAVATALGADAGAFEQDSEIELRKWFPCLYDWSNDSDKAESAFVAACVREKK
eukprot:gb/GFBE01057330.1/.p1 GENE.gb/GFBE01057330.1/~~gb/GFBE01057330.1/.p1  ORF type:complete len:1059 (+),score=252.99 gb/GFBE01057330.1/:1-3177(+)